MCKTAPRPSASVLHIVLTTTSSTRHQFHQTTKRHECKYGVVVGNPLYKYLHQVRVPILAVSHAALHDAACGKRHASASVCSSANTLRPKLSAYHRPDPMPDQSGLVPPRRVSKSTHCQLRASPQPLQRPTFSASMRVLLELWSCCTTTSRTTIAPWSLLQECHTVVGIVKVVPKVTADYYY